MDADTLSLLAGTVLALAFAYVPGLRPRFQALDGTHKRLVMLAALAFATLGAWGAACGGALETLACNRAGALDLLRALLLAMVANQGAFNLMTRPASAQEARHA